MDKIKWTKKYVNYRIWMFVKIVHYFFVTVFYEL